MKALIICFALTIALFVWLISDKLNDPRLITMLIIFPFFCIAILFAVFGKDLFKRSPKSNNTSQKESTKE